MSSISNGDDSGDVDRTTSRRWTRLGALALVLLVTSVVAIALARSPVTQYVSSDGPTYESVEQLTRAADLVVIGTVSRLAGTDVDYGTSDESEQIEEQGIPVAFYEIEVSETLKGDAPAPLIVGTADHSQIVSAESTPLEVGQTLLLFLRLEHPPGIDLYESVHTRLGQDNGVFDVAGDTARPRLPEMLSTGDTALDLESVRQEIAVSD